MAAWRGGSRRQPSPSNSPTEQCTRYRCARRPRPGGCSEPRGRLRGGSPARRLHRRSSAHPPPTRARATALAAAMRPGSMRPLPISTLRSTSLSPRACRTGHDARAVDRVRAEAAGRRGAPGDSPDRICVRGRPLRPPGLARHHHPWREGRMRRAGRNAAASGRRVPLPAPAAQAPARALDPDGLRYGARGGAGAAKARRRAHIAAGLQAITVPTPEYPLGTRTGMLQKAARQRLRPASRRGRRQRPPAAAAAAGEPTSCSRTSSARRRACRWTRPWRRAHRARPARRSRPAPCGCRCPSPCGS